MSATFALRPTGIDLPPVWATDTGVRDALDAVRRAGRGPARPRTPPGPRPMFRSPDGDEFVVLPSAAGPAVVPWVSGSPIDPDRRKPGAGGFVSRDLVRRPTDARLPDGPTRAELMALALRVLAQLGAAVPRPGQFYSKGSDRGSSPGGRPGETPSQPAPAQEGSSEDTTPTVAEAIRDALPGVLQRQAVAFLANAWADGGFNFSGLEGLPGNVLGGLAQAALGDRPRGRPPADGGAGLRPPAAPGLPGRPRPVRHGLAVGRPGTAPPGGASPAG